jgi:hypothetical protein
MIYTTFSGEKKDFNKIDHQHISNIYWYNMIVLERDIHFLAMIKKKINDEFGGDILPYSPHPDFKSEIESLNDMGYLIWQDEDKTWAKITWGEQIVGEYKSKLFLRNNKIDNLLQ